MIQIQAFVFDFLPVLDIKTVFQAEKVNRSLSYSVQSRHRLTQPGIQSLTIISIFYYYYCWMFAMLLIQELQLFSYK